MTTSTRRKKGCPRRSGFFWAKLRDQSFADLMVCEECEDDPTRFAITIPFSNECYANEDVEWHVGPIEPPKSVRPFLVPHLRPAAPKNG